MEKVVATLGPYASFILKSVGIDIGSATSHLLFSRLLMVRQGVSLQSRFAVAMREISHASNILLTPYASSTLIDHEKLAAFIKESYKEAGIEAGEIDTGAVIITGNAVLKENARPLANLFSQEAGKFVCATAGPRLEALLCAHGSGAVEYSKQNRKTVLNIDAGGGTTKLATAKNGEVCSTAAINIGGRVVSLDSKGIVDRIEESAGLIARAAGCHLGIGEPLSKQEQSKMVAAMTDCLFEFTAGNPMSPLTKSLALTEPLPPAKYDCIMFSGGVAEYIYGRETRVFGDLGRELGDAIRERAFSGTLRVPVVQPSHLITATVIGASQYTLQVSGSTVHISDPRLLPLRGVPVIKPRLDDEENAVGITLGQQVRKAVETYGLGEGEAPVALALKWRGEPSYKNINKAAKSLAEGLSGWVGKKVPVVLVFDSDVGRMIGHQLNKEMNLNLDLISIDELELGDFEFIDIGEQVKGLSSVPVVIKSLVFGGGNLSLQAEHAHTKRTAL